MATPKQESEVLQELKSLLDELDSIVPQELVKAGELGKELNFESGLPFFKRNLELLKRLNNQTLDSIPYNILSNLKNLADKQSHLFNEIREFSLSKYPQNAVQQRDQLIQNIQNAYDGLFQTITPVLAYLSDKDVELESLRTRAEKFVQEIQELQAKSQEQISTQMDELESTLEKVRRAAAEVGVSQHAVNFAEEAKYHERKGNHWLTSTIVIGIINVAYGFFIAFYYSDFMSLNLSTSQIIQSAISKLIVFSILSFSMLWSSRNYRAHRNGHIVNRHRQNALSTFETFVKATEDQQTKNAVLLNAAECIFSPQSSGYLTSDGDQVQNTKILEVIRGVIAKD